MERAHQGAHPRALSERDLAGLPLLWRGRGGLQLLRQVAHRPDLAEAPIWRPAEGAGQLPSARTRSGHGAAQLGPRPDGRGRLDHRRRGRGGQGRGAEGASRAARPSTATPTTSSKRSAASGRQRFGEDGLNEGGYYMRTTLDPRCRVAARRADGRPGGLRPPPRLARRWATSIADLGDGWQDSWPRSTGLERGDWRRPSSRREAERRRDRPRRRQRRPASRSRSWPGRARVGARRAWARRRQGHQVLATGTRRRRTDRRRRQARGAWRCARCRR